MTSLEEYYGKFNEEKRLLRPYGRVEYEVTMAYIQKYIQDRQGLKILDIGAATGRYTLPLAEMGHHVTAVELVNYNLGILKQKAERAGLLHEPDESGKGSIIGRQGNALNLKKYKQEKYDIILLLGPLYHLFRLEDKVQALNEAKACLSDNGVMLIAYCMNEFAVLQHGFIDGHMKKSIENHKLSGDFHVQNSEEDLFDFVRLEDIDFLNKMTGLKRDCILSPDGAANYLRRELSEMDEETFRLFIKYQLTICERKDLLGAGGHLLDIVRK